MLDIQVDLSSPERVQNFVTAITRLDGTFDLIAGKYILDARSIMGIFSLDLSAPVTLRIYTDTPETRAALQPFAASSANG